jgi:hypothetical protein
LLKVEEPLLNSKTNIEMHLPPELWGPIFWSTLHIVALAYPDNPSYVEKKAAKDFYTSLSHILPCPVCRSHFVEILKAMPVDTWVDSRANLIEWVWTVHNTVNKRLGKPEITLAEFHAKYKKMADIGLPYPPSSAVTAIEEATVNAAYGKGILHTVLSLTAVGSIGYLLWSSYK